MSTKKRDSDQATKYLNAILSEAVEVGADTVELERVPEGLEICLLASGSGGGTVLQDRALEGAIIELIVRRAGLKNRATDKVDWTVLGEQRSITVEEYDSFGESCFRLKLDKPRRHRSTKG